MAISNVTIANLALQKLGSPTRLESLTQDSPNARTLSACFASIRRAELRRYTWGFSVKRDSIAADGDQTVWGSLNRFSVPNDYLRLIRDDETGQAVDWKIEGLYIVTADAAPLEIKYIADITDPNYYDALFVESFAAKLALQTCKEITGSSNMQGIAKEDYDWAIAEAKRVGAIEKEAQAFPEDDWLNARL